MKKAKKLIIAVLAIVLVACCLFTACNSHEHDFSTVGKDANNHWKYCAEDEVVDESSITAHTFEQKADANNHWQECNVCGYIKEDSKVAHTSKVAYDENQHWTICEVCSHIIVDKADHTWGDKHDSDNSWKECTVCGAKQGETAIGSVSGTISLHRANDTTASGEEVTLVISKDSTQITAIEQKINADGSYSVLLLPGEYVFKFSKDGYIAVEETVTIVAGTPATQDVVLEFEAVKLATIPGFNADKHDFSHMNDENPYVTYLGQDAYESDESGMLNFQTVSAYDSATFSFLAKKGQSKHGEQRVGAYIQFYSEDEEGNAKVDYVWYTIKGSENKVEWFGMQMTEMGGVNANNLLAGHSWSVENGNLTEEEIAAFEGDGLTISLARHENYLFAMVGDRVCEMVALDKSYATKQAYVGMLAWKPAYLEGTNNFYYTISDFNTNLVPAKVNAELAVSGVDCDLDGIIGTLTFTNEFGSFDFDVEDNKVKVENLYAGTYTVTADDDLLPTVIEIKEGVNAIAFAKKYFEDHIIISTWGDHITQYYSMANSRVEADGKGYWVINKSLESYDNVAVTLNLDSRKYKDGWPMLQGIFVMFDNGEYLWVTTQQDGKTEWSGYNNFESEGRKNISNSTWNEYGDNSWALYDCNGNTIYGANGLSESEKTDFGNGDLPLTMVRDGSRIYVFLGGKLVGARVLDAKYAEMKAYVGITSLGAKQANEVYTYSLETDISEYAKQFGDANFKFEVSGADEHITVENGTSDYKIGDLSELTWEVQDGYVITSIKVNGKDVSANITSFKYFVLEKGQTVNVEFGLESVYDVTLAVTADESVKKLTFTAQDVNYSTTLDIEEGKVSGKLVYGKYKVTADAEGFIPTIITIGEESKAITIAKKEIADTNMNGKWTDDKIDESYNAATGKVELKLNDGWISQKTAASYNKVAVTAYVGKNNYANSEWLKSQGVIIWFGEDYVWVNICPEGESGKIEWGSGWAAQWTGKDISTTVPNKIEIDGIDAYKLIDAEGNKAFASLEGDYLDKWNNGTLPLTLVRDGSTVYVFLDSKLIGARTFDAKYADMEVYGGLCYTDCNGATVNYLIETDITKYAEQFGDASFKFEVSGADENITVTNDTSACKIGDLAELTWEVKEGYVVKSIKVNDNEIEASATSYKYFLLEKEQTVKVEFVIEVAPVEAPEVDE